MTSDKQESYRTIERRGAAEFIVKGSKFIAVIAQTSNRGEFQNFIEHERKKFSDATHHCWAFRIGTERIEELSGDDGEPSGSAGLPILRVIIGSGLINVSCVVTRYFGGTKLGVGGLMRAYTQSASAALKNAIIVEKLTMERLSIELPYDVHNEFFASLTRLGGNILDSKFAEKVSLLFDVPSRSVTEIVSIVAGLTHGERLPKKIKVENK